MGCMRHLSGVLRCCDRPIHPKSILAFSVRSFSQICDVVSGPSLLRTASHRPRPSLLYLPGLRSLPFWTQLDSSTSKTRIAYSDPLVQQVVSLLEENAEAIREEYVHVLEKSNTLQSDYQVDTEHKLHQGDWEWHSYMLKGAIQENFAPHFPFTSQILQNLRHDNLLFEGTPFGYSFFSTLHPHSSISAHSAPMNLRLRVHLPLIVPERDSLKENERPACGIRVGSTTRAWHSGKALVLDDSYDHEVWNETPGKRVLLLVDLWHPDVHQHEKEAVIGLFQHARKQGWLST